MPGNDNNRDDHDNYDIDLDIEALNEIIGNGGWRPFDNDEEELEEGQQISNNSAMFDEMMYDLLIADQSNNANQTMNHNLTYSLTNKSNFAIADHLTNPPVQSHEPTYMGPQLAYCMPDDSFDSAPGPSSRPVQPTTNLEDHNYIFHFGGDEHANHEITITPVSMESVSRPIRPCLSYKYHLDDYNHLPLKGYRLYCHKKVHYRNLQVIRDKYVTARGHTDALDENLGHLNNFRQLNNFNVQHCIHYGNTRGLFNPRYYLEKLNAIPQGRYLYQPMVKRVHFYKTRDITEGLCPYCPHIKFGEMKNSNYGHHLSIKHGIQTNGEAVPQPIGHSFYYCEKKNKVNWTNSIFEGVLCPVQNCFTVCRLSDKNKTDELGNRFLDYLRHYKEKHKSGKLIDKQTKRRSSDV